MIKQGVSSDEIGPLLLNSLGVNTENLMSAEIILKTNEPIVVNYIYLAECKKYDFIDYEEIETVMKSFEIVKRN